MHVSSRGIVSHDDEDIRGISEAKTSCSLGKGRFDERIQVEFKNGTQEHFRHQRNEAHEFISNTLLQGHDSAVDSLPPDGLPNCSWREIQIFFISASGDVNGVKKLLEAGIAVNARDYNMRSPLHLASERGHLELVEFLLSEGAEVNSKGREGETPLTLAVANKHVAVQQSLEKVGAVSGAKNRERNKLNLMHANFAVVEAFPRTIAMAILQGRRIEPISKDSVSIFVSDIVGFTGLSSQLPDSKVSHLLHRLFSKLDRLAYLHGVQKIDIIGDAYVAVTNLTEDQAVDHAARLARFALAAVQTAAGTDIDEDDPRRLGPVRIRVGLHCGQVVADAGGAQGLRYTLIGDAFAVARRMESAGATGRVQCSAAAAAAIAAQAHDLLLKPRPDGIPIPAAHGAAGVEEAAGAGRGRMETYWVTSLRRGLRDFGSSPDLSPATRPPCRRGSVGSHPRAVCLAAGLTPTASAAAAAAAAAAARASEWPVRPQDKRGLPSGAHSTHVPAIHVPPPMHPRPFQTEADSDDCQCGDTCGGAVDAAAVAAAGGATGAAAAMDEAGRMKERRRESLTRMQSQIFRL